MKKSFIAIVVVLISMGFGSAQSPFIKSAESDASTMLQTGDTRDWCPVCGMNLGMFYKTNHAQTFEDGTSHQYCSIRCLAVQQARHPDMSGERFVVDAKTEAFIPVSDAYYVIGSKVPGTMTRESKIAFASKRAAKQFKKRHRGSDIVRFEEAFQRAQEQMQADNAMLMKKRQNMAFPKGKKIYEKAGGLQEELPQFASITPLKAYLKQQPQFKKLNEKQLQMLALYVWGVLIPGGSDAKGVSQAIQVPESAKCPVCGMFVHKYPRWVASIALVIDGTETTYYFDGVKDMFKFYLNPSAWSKLDELSNPKLLVTDYYSQTALPGEHAFYVMGSDVLGPMGHELIPFASMEEAQTFMRDHAGGSIVRLADIDGNTIKQLDK